MVLLVFGCQSVEYTNEFGYDENSVHELEFFNVLVSAPEGYSSDVLESGNGVVFHKFVDNADWIIEDEEGNRLGYNVKLALLKQENVWGYENLQDMLATKYPDFTYEFVGQSVSDGVYVDEWRNEKAIRYFFIMDGDDYLYEASLEVDSRYYGQHVEDLAQVVDEARL